MTISHNLLDKSVNEATSSLPNIRKRESYTNRGKSTLVPIKSSMIIQPKTTRSPKKLKEHQIKEKGRKQVGVIVE